MCVCVYIYMGKKMCVYAYICIQGMTKGRRSKISFNVMDVV